VAAKTHTEEGAPVNSAAIRFNSHKKKVSAGLTRTIPLGEAFGLNIGTYLSKSFEKKSESSNDAEGSSSDAAAGGAGGMDLLASLTNEDSGSSRAPFISVGAQVECNFFPVSVGCRLNSNKEWGLRANVLIPLSTMIAMTEVGIFSSKAMGGLGFGLQVHIR